MSFNPLRFSHITKIPKKNQYVAPVDQYLEEHKDYSNRGFVVEKTFHNFDGYNFSRTLPLEEYQSPEKVPSERNLLGTGASPGVGGTPYKFLYGNPQPF